MDANTISIRIMTAWPARPARPASGRYRSISVCPYGYQRQESDDKIDSADDHALPEVRYCRIRKSLHISYSSANSSSGYMRILPVQASGYHRDAHYHGQQDKLHYHVIEQFSGLSIASGMIFLKNISMTNIPARKSRKVKNQVHHVDFTKFRTSSAKSRKYYERRFGGASFSTPGPGFV